MNHSSTNSNRIIRHRAGLLNLAQELGNVSKACKIMGVSQYTFYHYKEMVDNGGIETLVNQSRRVPNLKNQVVESTEQAVIQYGIDYPAHRLHRTSNELRKVGIFVSDSSVRFIWLRHNLEHFKKCLKVLEAKVEAKGILLSDEQISALERKKLDNKASGEIETAHPGFSMSVI